MSLCSEKVVVYEVFSQYFSANLVRLSRGLDDNEAIAKNSKT